MAKSIILVLLTFLALQSCKLDNQKDKASNSEEKDTAKLSLSQMETQNGKLIDSVEKRIVKQIKTADFVNMIQEADTSLTNLISVKEVKTYFKMIDDFYGHLDSLKTYGTVSTENGKTLDYIANFSTGDSLELNFKLRFYKKDVKLSYITMNRFIKNPIPKNILEVIKPKIDNIFKQNKELVYDDCSSLFKTKISKEKLFELLDKKFKSNTSDYVFIDCKPLIFGKNQVGFTAKTQKKFENGITKKIDVLFFLDDAKNFKIADIQISK